MLFPFLLAFTLARTHTHTQSHPHSLARIHTNTHTHSHTSREVTVSMVLSPRDPGCGLQEMARCKLGERWVQSLVSQGLVLFLLMLCHSLAPPWDTGGQGEDASGVSSFTAVISSTSLPPFHVFQSAVEHLM